MGGIERVDAVVIGAGVVGLACARALALAGREVLLLDAAGAIGTGVSSRSSEVVHAGLYYPPGSWRARLCVEGARQLLDFCPRHGVALDRCGKLVVAQGPDDEAALQRLQAQARACGVSGLQWLDAAAARALEPALRCTAALLSPTTAIVDSHGLMQVLLAQAQAHGTQLVLRTPVLGGRPGSQGLTLQTGGADPMRLRARTVVNAAGLQACALARALGTPAAAQPRAWMARGAYLRLRGPAPFRHLIYPVPGVSSHLGVHLTLDLAGRARFGPGFRWIDREDYRPAEGETDDFEPMIRRYWPGLPEGALEPDDAGIRPKISGPGEPAADFRLDDVRVHGIPGLIQLLGIESPGLTSALALGDWVAARAAALSPP